LCFLIFPVMREKIWLTSTVQLNTHFEANIIMFTCVDRAQVKVCGVWKAAITTKSRKCEM
jgi:hypothetical protein